MDNAGVPQISNHIKVFTGSKENKKNEAPREASIDFYSQNHIQKRAKLRPKMKSVLSL